MDSRFRASAAEPAFARHAHWFAEAANTYVGNVGSTTFYSSLADSVWTPHIIMSLQTLALPFAFWFKPLCVCLALFWLTYRAYRVLNKPLDELASLLGFDIPLTPLIDLAGIKADGAIIHWSIPEKQKHKSTFKYEIHVNGSIIDTVSVQESAVTISGLQPSSFYVIRIALVNNLEFSSKSAPIHFRTKPAASADFFHLPSDGHDTDHDTTHEPLPRVKPYRGLKDVARASSDIVTPSLTRDNSANLNQRKSVTARRVSPANASVDSRRDVESDDMEAVDGGDTIQHLTERLDAIRRETEEAERQARDEEEEELRQKEDLIRERDELRAEVAEKEKASRNLKREVNIMERQNTAAQNERTKHERQLQQKLQEREKLKDDSIRWVKEAEQMKGNTQRIKQQEEEFLIQAEKEKELLRQKLSEENAAVKGLDEDIRETNAEIKRLERVAKNHTPTGSEHQLSLVEQLQQDAEEDRQWHARRYDLQQQYASAAQKLEQAKNLYANNMRFLDSMRAERRRHEEVAAAAAAASAREFAGPVNTQDRLPSRRDSQRSRRGNSGPNISDSPLTTTFATPVSQPAFGSGITSSGFPTAPFLNIHNGMTISGPIDGGMSDDDRERLTGGAHMSPGAGEGLLPADLFASESDPRSAVLPLPGLGALPGLPGPLPGLGQPPATQEYYAQGPASPASASSKAPSTFASPQASQQNLHLGSPEALMDSDRRSIRSNRSGRQTSGGGGAGSRFSSMFGIKPRHKNAAIDDANSGFPLSKTHSHSMPRQDQGLPGLDSAARKRNSSISGAVFGGVIGKPDDDEASSLADEQTESSVPPKRRPFTLNPFSKDKTSDGWPSNFVSPFGRRPTSPRPNSTHSGELPRPSFDSSRWGVDAWPSNDGGTGARSSPLSLGGWNTPINQSRIFGSRHPSRRQSMQHVVSGPPDDIMEDEDSDVLDPDQETQLAPIGTRPTPGSKKAGKQADVRLNPNAKDFKSFLSSMRLRDREKSKESAEHSGNKSLTPISSNPTPGKDSAEDDSPTASRKSRDARSITTAESSVAESGRNSSDLALTPSYSNSEAAPSPQIGTGSSFGRESFMQKLSRKSSSGKFGLPTFKREKSKLDRETPNGSPAIPAADDEDDMSASVGSLKEPRESSEKVRSSGRNWSNVLKLGKKKGGGETPSVSGLSMASDTNEENGDDTS